jgi:hypothetical protein
MANSILIMGESGTGKSSSIRQLNPKETFVINVLDKALPFKDFKKNYIGGVGGNYYATDNAASIQTTITSISQKRLDIKTIIIDDFQYIMANQYMRSAKEKGFEKFVEIGQSAWKIIRESTALRPDLSTFILSHTETDPFGKVKCKTIGRMLDEKITLEGMFTVVLHSLIVDGKYKFLTQNDGVHNAKSPLDMFDKSFIDNDLLYVKEKMAAYYGDEIQPPKPVVTDKKQKEEMIKEYREAIEKSPDKKTLTERFAKAQALANEWNDTLTLEVFRNAANTRRAQLPKQATV